MYKLCTNTNLENKEDMSDIYFSINPYSYWNNKPSINSSWGNFQQSFLQMKILISKDNDNIGLTCSWDTVVSSFSIWWCSFCGNCDHREALHNLSKLLQDKLSTWFPRLFLANYLHLSFCHLSSFHLSDLRILQMLPWWTACT